MEAGWRSSVCAPGCRRSSFTQLDTGKTVEVADTRDAATPMFSADSQWVAFGQAGLIKKIPAAGGPVEAVAPGAAGPMAWLSDGRFVRGNMSGSPIRQLRPDDRRSRSSPRAKKATSHRLLMPRRLAACSQPARRLPEPLNSILVRPHARRRASSCPTRSSPQLVGTDAIVFARGRALFAAGFDSRAIRLTGEPRAMDVQVQTTLVSRRRRCMRSPTMARSCTPNRPAAAVWSGSIVTGVKNS